MDYINKVYSDPNYKIPDLVTCAKLALHITSKFPIATSVLLARLAMLYRSVAVRKQDTPVTQGPHYVIIII